QAPERPRSMTGSVDHPSLSRSCSCRRIQLPQGRSTRLARAVVVRREPAFEVGCSGPGEWPLVFCVLKSEAIADDLRVLCLSLCCGRKCQKQDDAGQGWEGSRPTVPYL